MLEETKNAINLALILFLCYCGLLRISDKDHFTIAEVQNKITKAAQPHEDILTTVKKQNLKWFGHVTRSTGLAKTILQGAVLGKRKRGRQRRRREDNITDWTGKVLSDNLRRPEEQREMV